MIGSILKLYVGIGLITVSLHGSVLASQTLDDDAREINGNPEHVNKVMARHDLVLENLKDAEMESKRMGQNIINEVKGLALERGLEFKNHWIHVVKAFYRQDSLRLQALTNRAPSRKSQVETAILALLVLDKDPEEKVTLQSPVTSPSYQAILRKESVSLEPEELRLPEAANP